MFRFIPVLFLVACGPAMEQGISEVPLPAVDESEAGEASGLTMDVTSPELLVATPSAEDVEIPVDTDVPQVQFPGLTVDTVIAQSNDTELWYEIVVRNDGAKPSKAAEIDVFIDQPSAPSPGDIGSFIETLPALNAGETYTTTVYTDSATFEACKVGCDSWVVVDSRREVFEGDETNNVFGPLVTEPTVLGPDLQVDMTWSETAIGFEFSVTVTNTGDEDAPEFMVDLYGDQDDAPELYDAGEDWHTVYGLAAGEAETFTLSTTRYCAVECTAWMLVDTADAVVEADETNNVYGPVAVLATPPAPADANLQVVDVTWSDVGSGFEYEVTVRNIGGTEAVDFWVDVFVDSATAPAVNSTGDNYTFINGLAPQAETTVQITANGACTLGCSSWVLLDSSENVEEGDENDNVAGPYDVLSTELPDLRVAEIVAYPNNGDLTYSFLVENIGSADMAADAELHLFFEDWSLPSMTDTSGFVATIERIDAGETSWVTFSTNNADVLNDCSYGCFVTANADPTDELPEEDDGNNQLDIHVTPTP
jgi:subtilase family serine protease